MSTESEDLAFREASELLKKKLFQNKVYSDRPILFTANKLLEDSDEPERFREIREIAKDRRPGITEGERFYRQSLAMRDYEENDFVFRGSYRSVYPSFSAMNTDQLRGYFAWRTKIRKDRYERTEYSFLILYVSELLNLTICDSAEEGFEQLTDFIEKYSKIDSYILFQGMRWVKNFAIYHNIPGDVYHSRVEEKSTDGMNEPVAVAIDYKKYTPDEVVSALLRLSPFDVTKSKWYKSDFKLANGIIYRAYDALFRKYENSTETLIQRFFPFMRKVVYPMTFNNLFWQPGPHPDCVYRLSSTEVYECRNNVWTCSENTITSYRYKSPEIGFFLKACDYNSRDYFAVVPQIAEPPVPQSWNKLIYCVIDDYCTDLKNAEREMQRQKIKIDTSKLDSIRSDSEITREKLLTTEEKSADEDVFTDTPTEETLPEADTQPPAVASPTAENSHEKTETEGVFTPVQREFISLVMSGGNLKAFAKSHGKFISGFADEINGIALDYIGDTVIDCDGTSAEIVPDYSDELKELAKL